MADFRLNVSAETRDAERKLQAVDKAANEATKARSLKIDVSALNKNFKDIDKNVREAGNTIQQFYRISKNIPGIGDRVREFEGLAKGAANLAKSAPGSAAALRENAKAGSILASTFQTAGGAASQLVDNLARTGLALFAVKQAVGVLQSAFGGFFNSTIGREIKLRETLLKTQTTLASNNKVFSNGKEITDPLEKIKALRAPVVKAIEDIRIKSLELSGTTSEQVIEVFGVVASQISQVGGGLEEAKDLAISFSAALATFGVPFEQARQEIGSILRGDITQDSYLAKALGIDSQAIAKAKTETGGVVKFVEDKLATAVAGQAIAAQGFAGITSNIQEIAQLVQQSFGAGLLDPLLGGLTNVYTFLFKIGSKLRDLSKATGEGIGGTLASIGTQIGGGSSLLQKVTGGAGDFTAQLTEGVKQAFASLQADANQIVAPLRNIFEQIALSIGAVGKGLADLTKGFVSINIENIKALAQLISNLIGTVTALASAFGGLLSAYGQILQAPMVQYISQITVQFQLLEKVGVMSAVKLTAAAIGLLAAWKPIVAFFQNLVSKIVALLAGIVIATGALVIKTGELIAKFTTTLTATVPVVAAFKAELTSLSASFLTAGAAAEKAGTKIGSISGATAKAAKGIAGFIVEAVKANVLLFLVQAAVAVALDTFGRYQKEQEKIAKDKRAQQALVELRTTYKDVGDTAAESTRRAKEFREALVDAQYTDALDQLEKVRAKLQEINDLTSGKKKDFGDYLRKIAQMFNPENLTVTQKPGETFSDAVYREQLEKEKKAKGEVDRWSKELDKKSLAEKITLEASKRTDLTKEIADLERSHADKLFQTRQQAASKEVEVFRAAGELRIFQMEQANKKLIEGEEGASAAALEALNTYLSTRERGELDIEASKKSLAIEITNLERSVMDYKLDMEKKIAEIRKRSNENDVKTADYRKQQLLAGGATGAAGSGDSIQAAVAATKNLTGVNEQCAEAVKRFMAVIGVNSAVMDKSAKSAEKMGTVMTDWSKLQPGDIVARGSKGDPEHVGVFTGGQNVFHQSSGRGLKTGNFPDLGYFKEQGYFVRPSGMSGSSAPVAPPDLKGNSDISSASVYAKDYAGALKQVTSAMERMQVLQKALTDAKTAADFKAIADAAFPKVQLEGYRDEIIKAEESLKQLAGTTAEAYDPEKLQIQADLQAKIKIAELEKEEILKKARENQKVTQKELGEIERQLEEKRKKTIKDLEEEARQRKKILELERQKKALEDLKQATKDIGFNTQREAVAIAARSAGAYAGNDPAAARRIQAEVDIANKRIEYEQQGLKGSELEAQLKEFADKTRAAAEELGKLDTAAQAYQEKMALLTEAVQTIVGAQKTAIKSILQGGDIKEAIKTMATSMADKFLDMSLDAIFKPIEKQMTEQFKKMFGIEDPLQSLQEQNNVALGTNTEALRALALALTTGGGAGGGVGGMLGGLVPETSSFASFFDYQGGGSTTPFSSFWNGSAGQTYDTSAYTMKGLNFGGGSIPGLNFGKAAEQTGEAAASTGLNLDKLLGSIGSFATGIMGIYAGIQQISKGGGGASSWLIGIGSVLSGVGSVLGGFGSLGKKAGGGPVSSGRPYLVGEVGPEMFVPQNSGTVVPTNKVREAMGTTPGSTQSPILNMSFQTSTIGGVEYVSKDQLMQAMMETRRQASREGAQRGMTMTLDKLQQSPATRTRLGMR